MCWSGTAGEAARGCRWGPTVTAPDGCAAAQKRWDMRPAAILAPRAHYSRLVGCSIVTGEEVCQFRRFTQTQGTQGLGCRLHRFCDLANEGRNDCGRPLSLAGGEASAASATRSGGALAIGDRGAVGHRQAKLLLELGAAAFRADGLLGGRSQQDLDLLMTLLTQVLVKWHGSESEALGSMVDGKVPPENIGGKIVEGPVGGTLRSSGRPDD